MFCLDFYERFYKGFFRIREPEYFAHLNYERVFTGGLERGSSLVVLVRGLEREVLIVVLLRGLDPWSCSVVLIRGLDPWS
jgi:hypothetical protein